MSALWVLLGVVAFGGAVVVLLFLMKVLTAARQLQRNVQVLGDAVTDELRRLGGDMAELGESIDKKRRR
ncbi:MAG TPA: hypothetical protein VE760_05905 [Acidimicrobiales bacterium]|jgi:hypothetical protein|nr:hypothetical protein [Acidimicrobiales bacterium]